MGSTSRCRRWRRQGIRLSRLTCQMRTTSGYGPRYLHSTGQLHKGGPDRAVFLQLTADDPEDLPMPEAPYGFGTLKRAQALGDFRALQSKGRRVMRLHLGADATAGLGRLVDSIQQSAAPAATLTSQGGR